jgi:hypothetical protein
MHRREKQEMSMSSFTEVPTQSLSTEFNQETVEHTKQNDKHHKQINHSDKNNKSAQKRPRILTTMQKTT